VPCGARQTGLRARSVANVSQLTVLNRTRLVEKVGAVPALLLRQVEEGIRLVLGM
jgi:mRNA-degrading endonuclease toxin of MazEF toxin-antitoxin module